MKKILLILAMGALFATVSQATTLSFYDEDYVGRINDGIPSSPAKQAGYVDNLITLAIDPTPGFIGDYTPIEIGTEYYDRDGSDLDPIGGFPSVSGYIKLYEGSDNSIAFDGTYQYILAKYDQNKAGAFVWYDELGFSGTESDLLIVPASFGQYGLSHITAFNFIGDPGEPPPPGYVIPEPATMFLFGIGLMSIAGISRRKKSEE